MSLHLSVILFTGGTWAGTPPRTRCTRWSGIPPGRHPSRTRYPPGTRYTPRTRYTPLQQMATVADGTHPTGMHFCNAYFDIGIPPKHKMTIEKKRIHSSRMRPICSSSHVYPSMHWAGWVYPRMHWTEGGCIPACTGIGGSAWRGCLPRGCVYPSMHWGRHPLWTEWQTGVKTLLCRNYVADGKNHWDMKNHFDGNG